MFEIKKRDGSLILVTIVEIRYSEENGMEWKFRINNNYEHEIGSVITK